MRVLSPCANDADSAPSSHQVKRVIDGKQRKCLEDILHTSLPVAAWQQAQLGVRLGGLALRSVEAHAEAAFVGCLKSNKWVSEQTKLALLSNENISWC